MSVGELQAGRLRMVCPRRGWKWAGTVGGIGAGVNQALAANTTVVPAKAKAGTHNHQSILLTGRWLHAELVSQQQKVVAMGPRLRGDDSGV